jgi:mono/diheme cytochrome c family protein
LLEAAYPQDRATGFEEGDLRGFIWAEAPVVATTAKAATMPLAEVSRGKELFGEANPRCTICHSVAGKGNLTGIALDGVGRRLTPEEIKAWIRDPVAMAKKRASTKKPPMLPYPEFSDEELDAVVAYLASLGPAPGRP